MKRIVDCSELKKIEEDSRQNVLLYITPVKQKLENIGYAVENKFFYTSKKAGKRKIYQCEISIYPDSLTKSEAKKQFKLKVFRLFIYEKEQLDKCNFYHISVTGITEIFINPLRRFTVEKTPPRGAISFRGICDL